VSKEPTNAVQHCTNLLKMENSDEIILDYGELDNSLDVLLKEINPLNSTEENKPLQSAPSVSSTPNLMVQPKIEKKESIFSRLAPPSKLTHPASNGTEQRLSTTTLDQFTSMTEQAKRDHRCPACNYTSNHPQRLRRHIGEHNYAYICFCGYGNKSYSMTYRHQENKLQRYPPTRACTKMYKVDRFHFDYFKTKLNWFTRFPCLRRINSNPKENQVPQNQTAPQLPNQLLAKDRATQLKEIKDMMFNKEKELRELQKLYIKVNRQF